MEDGCSLFSPFPSPRRNRRNDRLRRRAPRRTAFGAMTLTFLCLSACASRRNPQVALDHATQIFHRGEVSKAADEAELGYKEFRGVSLEWAWRFTILRATVLNWEGMSGRALAILASEPDPPLSGDLAVQRHRLESSAYGSSHKFPEAERELEAAEQLCTGTSYSACSELAGVRGVLQMRRGHYAEAQGQFERALTAPGLSQDRFTEATLLLNLSWSADEQTHFDEALDWADAAQRIAVPSDFADLAQAALGNMGWAYYKLGDPEKSEGMFIEAKDEAQKLGNAASEVGWLTDLGYVYMDEGNIGSAEQAFQQSLQLAQQIKSQEDVVNSLIALAFVSEQTGKLDDTKNYTDQALAMARADGNGRDVVYPLLVEGRLAARKHHATTAEADFHEVAKSADTPVFLRWEAERSLARLYEDENQPDAADKEYRTALSTFEAARCDLHERVDSRLPFLSNAARIYEDYIHFLVVRGQEHEALQVADYGRARTLAEGLGRACKPAFSPDALHGSEIARRAGGTILFYALGQEHSYLWVITPHQVRLFPLPAKEAEIDAAVQRYRKKLEGPPEILKASNDGGVLYQMLVAPAEKMLKPASSRSGNVFIIPDGGLSSLNFETLLPQPKHYWIEDVTIVNAASLHTMPEAPAGNENLNGKLLLVGDPVAPDAGTEGSYPELPNAAAQMKSVEKYFSSNRLEVFARKDASPAAYLNHHPEQFSYIHFVAHGTASRMNPLDSAIILSRGSESGTPQDDSFKLYARQIIGTHRLRANLVTISACYSTGNRTYSGEGLVGLSWAFLRAGAHNVIAALWDVSDVSTPELVDKFYGELKNGKSPSAALRTAKLCLLHTSRFKSPFYWAPFQLYTGS
jgi:CHAT domain-containing protein/Tfp pilus assembly protein PilF